MSISCVNPQRSLESGNASGFRAFVIRHPGQRLTDSDIDHHAASGDPPPVPVTVGLDLGPLLRSASAGDEEAWRSIVRLYARRVYALARSRLCTSGVGESGAGGGRGRGYSPDGLFVQGHDVAEEVTQSVFVTVASKLSSGQYTERGRFESWLFRVAMNRIRDEVRRSRRQASPTDPEVLDAGASQERNRGDENGSVEELASLRDALGRLTEQDREIVELRHHAGLSFKQMADMLAEPIGTLLARHHRALRKLKELMTGGAAGAPPMQVSGDA